MHKDTGDVERYTADYIINAVRDFNGGFIDLDPASCLEANKSIGAETIFTKEDDALTKDWFGHIWMNHPFSRQNNPIWTDYAYQQWRNNPEVLSLINISFSSTSSDWWQLHADRSKAICYPKKRSCYKKKPTDKSGAMKDSSIFYFGNQPERFKKVFQEIHNIGVVKF